MACFDLFVCLFVCCKYVFIVVVVVVVVVVVADNVGFSFPFFCFSLHLRNFMMLTHRCTAMHRRTCLTA